MNGKISVQASPLIFSDKNFIQKENLLIMPNTTTTLLTLAQLIDLAVEKMIEQTDQAAKFKMEEYVRIYPDGTITTGTETSQVLTESEFNNEVPRTLTIWAAGYLIDFKNELDFNFIEHEEGNYLFDPTDGDYILFEEKYFFRKYKGYLRGDFDRSYEGLLTAAREAIEEEIREDVIYKIETWVEAGNATFLKD